MPYTRGDCNCRPTSPQAGCLGGCVLITISPITQLPAAAFTPAAHGSIVEDGACVPGSCRNIGGGPTSSQAGCRDGFALPISTTTSPITQLPVEILAPATHRTIVKNRTGVLIPGGDRNCSSTNT